MRGLGVRAGLRAQSSGLRVVMLASSLSVVPVSANCSHTWRMASPKAMKIGPAIGVGEGRGSVEPLEPALQSVLDVAA